MFIHLINLVPALSENYFSCANIIGDPVGQPCGEIAGKDEKQFVYTHDDI